MTDATPSATWLGRSTWARKRTAPLRAFLLTESGSAGVLFGAVVVALLWANLDVAGYESFWHTKLAVSLGDSEVSRDLRRADGNPHPGHDEPEPVAASGPVAGRPAGSPAADRRS